MQNKVQIVPDELGTVIRVSQNNSEFGHVRLQQERVTFGNTGWVNRKTVSTLLHGKVEDLRDMGLHNMKELAGKIVIRESLEPFNSNDPDRDLKIAGDTGIVCCQDGQPIYRKTIFTADTNAEDVLVAHNNGDAIREANQNTSSSKPTTATVEEAFDVEDNKQVDLEDSIAEVNAEALEEEVEEVEELEDSTFEL
jgi:hypothetical protein